MSGAWLAVSGPGFGAYASTGHSYGYGGYGGSGYRYPTRNDFGGGCYNGGYYGGGCYTPRAFGFLNIDLGGHGGGGRSHHDNNIDSKEYGQLADSISVATERDAPIGNFVTSKFYHEPQISTPAAQNALTVALLETKRDKGRMEDFKEAWHETRHLPFGPARDQEIIRVMSDLTQGWGVHAHQQPPVPPQGPTQSQSQNQPPAPTNSFPQPNVGPAGPNAAGIPQPDPAHAVANLFDGNVNGANDKEAITELAQFLQKNKVSQVEINRIEASNNNGALNKTASEAIRDAYYQFKKDGKADALADATVHALEKANSTSVVNPNLIHSKNHLGSSQTSLA